jgi:hypothetical protein
MSRRDNPAFPLRSYAFFEPSDGPVDAFGVAAGMKRNRHLFGRCPREEYSSVCQGGRQQIPCAAVDGLVRFAPINNASLNIEMALLSDANFSMERYERNARIVRNQVWSSESISLLRTKSSVRYFGSARKRPYAAPHHRCALGFDLWITGKIKHPNLPAMAASNVRDDSAGHFRALGRRLSCPDRNCECAARIGLRCARCRIVRSALTR